MGGVRGADVVPVEASAPENVSHGRTNAAETHEVAEVRRRLPATIHQLDLLSASDPRLKVRTEYEHCTI